MNADLKRLKYIYLIEFKKYYMDLVFWPRFYEILFILWLIIYLGCPNKFPFIKICLVLLLALLVLWWFHIRLRRWWGLIVYFIFITAILVSYTYLSATLGLDFEEDSDYKIHWILESFGFVFILWYRTNPTLLWNRFFNWNPLAFIIRRFYLLSAILLFILLVIICFRTYKKKNPLRPKY